VPYDEALVERVRDVLMSAPGLVEKKMFGGIGWTLFGHMAAGAHSDGRLMIRCSRGDFPALLAEPGASGLMRGGKPLTGWVLVDADAVEDDAALALWVGRGRTYASSLPPK
jgi:hypothetical protein